MQLLNVLQKMRENIEILKLSQHKKEEGTFTKPNYTTTKLFTENLSAIEIKKKKRQRYL